VITHNIAYINNYIHVTCFNFFYDFVKHALFDLTYIYIYDHIRNKIGGWQFMFVSQSKFNQFN
jgi:hypothetical protein